MSGHRAVNVADVSVSVDDFSLTDGYDDFSMISAVEEEFSDYGIRLVDSFSIVSDARPQSRSSSRQLVHDEDDSYSFPEKFGKHDENSLASFVSVNDQVVVLMDSDSALQYYSDLGDDAVSLNEVASFHLHEGDFPSLKSGSWHFPSSSDAASVISLDSFHSCKGGKKLSYKDVLLLWIKESAAAENGEGDKEKNDEPQEDNLNNLFRLTRLPDIPETSALDDEDFSNKKGDLLNHNRRYKFRSGKSSSLKKRLHHRLNSMERHHV